MTDTSFLDTLEGAVGEILCKVVDGISGEPLAGATAQVISISGKVVASTQAGDGGYLQMQSDALLNPDNKLKFTYAGYGTEVYSNISGLPDEVLMFPAGEIAGVTVLPKTNYILIGIAVILMVVVAALFLFKKSN